MSKYFFGNLREAAFILGRLEVCKVRIFKLQRNAIVLHTNSQVITLSLMVPQVTVDDQIVSKLSFCNTVQTFCHENVQ